MRRLLYLLMMAGTGIGLWQLSEKATPSVNSVQDVEQKADFSDLSLAQEDPSAIEAVKQKEVPLKKDEIAIIPLHPKPILINSPVNPVMEAEVLAYEEWKSKPEFREVKNIHPPIPGVEAPAKAVMLNPEDLTKPNIVDLGFGAFLHIPADALVMENGKAPTEPVKISYCPLNDPVDIFLSGVPMKYDSAGSSETFRTAGMFRLEAKTYSGKQVALKNGMQMQVDMPTVDSSDTYNFYTFNEDEGGWKFDEPAAPSISALEITLDTFTAQFDFDATPFAQKFENEVYHYLLPPGKHRNRYEARPSRWLFGGDERNVRQALYGTNYRSANFIKLKGFYAEIGYDEDGKRLKEVRFRLKPNGVGNQYFKELSCFNAFNFSVDDVETLSEFYRKYSRGSRFHDIRVEYEKGTDECVFVLKDLNGFRRIRAKIHIGHRAELNEFAMARFNWSYSLYQKRLAKKAKLHDNIIRSRKSRFIQMSMMLGNRPGAWMGNQYRRIRLSGFGTYNCDQVARMRRPKPVATKYKNEEGEVLSIDQITVCDTKVRATFAFPGNMEAQVSESGMGFLLLQASDGDTYYLNRSAWVPDQKVCRVKRLPDIENSVQLREALLK